MIDVMKLDTWCVYTVINRRQRNVEASSHTLKTVVLLSKTNAKNLWYVEKTKIYIGRTMKLTKADNENGLNTSKEGITIFLLELFKGKIKTNKKQEDDKVPHFVDYANSRL